MVALRASHRPPAGRAVWPAVATYPLFDLEGQPVRVDSLKGKVVLLAFVYTRCTSVCRAYRPACGTSSCKCPLTPRSWLFPFRWTPSGIPPAGQTLFDQLRRARSQVAFLAAPLQKWAFDMAETAFGIAAARLDSTDILHTDALFLIDS